MTRRALGALARWYRGLSFSRKLALFPTLTGAALAVVLLVTGAMELVAARQLGRIERESYPSVEVMWTLSQTLRDLERTLQDAATTGDAEALAEADSIAGAFSETLARRPNGVGDPAHAGIAGRFAAYYPVAREVSARLIAHGTGDSLAAALTQMNERHQALRAALDRDARADRATIGHAFERVRERLRRAWLVCLALAVAASATLAALSRLATTSLSIPLRQAVRVANRVAAGDLGVELPSADDTEIGQLLQSMDHMVRNLRDGERRLVHQATHDALTGLPNRVLFRERVERATAAAGADGARPAVLYVDLDHFKDVNDALGHHVGDAVLVEVADRLLGATRGSDTVARLGGDEFAILLRGVVDAAEAVVVAERVTQALMAPVRAGHTEVRVGASVGIALGGEAADDLVRRADMAMYAVKHDRRGGHRVYETAMHTAVSERLALESDLRGALERGEFGLRYQPIVELATGRLVGAEALVRWLHPTRGTISPATFIPVAESTGLIVPLGGWVLREACRQAAEWHRALGGDPNAPAFRISVNLSVWQIRDAALVDEVRRALADAGLPATALTLEITESVMLRQTDVTLQRLHALKALGVRLAIDDFGTGYSSLSYLQRLPIDVLKIDKTFVDDIAAGDAPITRAIIALGGALRLRVVAEGVETRDQAEALRRLGCKLGQGYHFARPLEAGDLETRLLTAAAA